MTGRSRRFRGGVVRFDAYVDAEETARSPPAGNAPEGLTITEFPVAGKYEVLTLELTLGQKLTLAVTAADGDTLTGPHERSTEKFVFTIVSNDELLALVAAKELNLRRRFEQILDEVRNAAKTCCGCIARRPTTDGACAARHAHPEGRGSVDRARSGRRVGVVERVNSGLLRTRTNWSPWNSRSATFGRDRKQRGTRHAAVVGPVSTTASSRRSARSTRKT